MNKVHKTKLPLQSLLNKKIQPFDFIDCYAVQSNLSPRQAAQIITDFPVWAKLLVKIRNVITKPFGLSEGATETEDKIGFFPVEIDNSNELIAGFNDKHLDFKIAVIAQKGSIYLATWVHTNNIGGKIYLKSILLFHILIVRNALSRLKKQ